MTSTIPAPSYTAGGYIGALDVLANYWITRIDYETRSQLKDTSDTPEEWRFHPTALPQSNLGGSASEALFQYPSARGCTQEQANARAAGFQVGFAFALALSQDPLNAEARLQAVFDEQFAADRATDE